MRNDDRSNIPAEQPRGRTSHDEYGRGAESDCARAMAEIERVLRELALTRRSSPERLSSANEASNAPSLVPAPSPIDRLVLDAGLDFIFHKDGMIELTEAGFRRMGQVHSAGLDTVIEVDQRYLLRFPASLPRVEDRFSAIYTAPATLVLAPRRCVTNLSGKPLRLLWLLACSPRQVIQCQRPECFRDARRTALTCKQFSPFG